MGRPEGRPARAWRAAPRRPRRGPPARVRSSEGEIPQGNYGAGTVEIWDRGTYELLEEKRDGGLTVRLHGERLEGTWALVPAHLSGTRRTGRSSASATRGSTFRRRVYRPMLATLTEGAAPWRGLAIRAEVRRLPGPRVCAWRGSQALLSSRQRPDRAVLGVAKEIAKALSTPDAVVDGEVARLDADGRASFSGCSRGALGSRTRYSTARDRRRADGRPAADRAQGSAREAARAESGRPALRLVRGRRGAARGGAEQGLEGVMANAGVALHRGGRAATG